jgi:hypothetical protein
MSNEWFAYWIMSCGMIFSVWLVYLLAKLCGQLIYTALAAASFTRFAWACGRVHGFNTRRFPLWIYAPAVWGSFFCTSLGIGTVSCMGGAGQWRGIGDWTVYPRKEDQL